MDFINEIQQKNLTAKKQFETIVQENNLLKRAVVTQRKRQRESEDQSQDLQHLRQMVTQYQEQHRTLEVNNYALTLHLKQAQQNNSSTPDWFHPDKSILGDIVTDLSLHYLTKAKIMAIKDVERYEIEFVTKILNCFLIPNIEHFRAENLGVGAPEIELSRQLGAWAKVLHRMDGSV
ncbi:hypothetical protein IGI04_035420 [Brassica rapa subsp. trilocularis]|uniref:Uncharacterized protein n=1 Tax=Brassica rapa subsp. trilocularis TaxID=1813537 RepID=A0ABQ7LEC1_BRACM|nr:hypothetical protein IGI04_035420 [Brassica rapa subsp. trilocularis]